MTAPVAFKVFFDTEFLEHAEGFGIDPVSIGMVSETGAEFYAVFNDFNPAISTPWRDEHVLAKLPPREEWKPREIIAAEIVQWFLELKQAANSDRIEFWAKNGAYDAFILCQAVGGMGSLKQELRDIGFEKTNFRDTNELRMLAPSVKLTPQPEDEAHISINDARFEKIHFDEMSAALNGQKTIRRFPDGPSGMR